MTGLCAFPACGRPSRALGLCAPHYTQQRIGRPLTMLRPYAPPSLPLEARLLARVEYDTNGPGCWLWAGEVDRLGYGIVEVAGVKRRAHREAHLLWVGPLPPEAPLACHHCDMPGCIRPDHLFAGTDADNMADRDRKGRWRDWHHL